MRDRVSVAKELESLGAREEALAVLIRIAAGIRHPFGPESLARELVRLGQSETAFLMLCSIFDDEMFIKTGRVSVAYRVGPIFLGGLSEREAQQELLTNIADAKRMPVMRRIYVAVALGILGHKSDAETVLQRMSVDWSLSDAGRRQARQALQRFKNGYYDHPC